MSGLESWVVKMNNECKRTNTEKFHKFSNTKDETKMVNMTS